MDGDVSGWRTGEKLEIVIWESMNKNGQGNESFLFVPYETGSHVLTMGHFL